MAWLRTQLARAGSAVLLAIAATPTALDPSALAWGWDPSGAVALPPVQNIICQESGAFCKRQNQIRLDTLDYNASFGNPASLAAASGDDGWHAFVDLDPIYGDESCINYKRINYITSHFGTFNGSLLLFSGDSPLDGKFSQQWDFRPITDWISASSAMIVNRANAVSGRQFIFDFSSSTNHPMPSDIAITIHLQVIQDGTPRPDMENTFKITFPQGEDVFSDSCALPTFAPGNYQLNFLVSDDFFGEDRPVTILLNVTGH